MKSICLIFCCLAISFTGFAQKDSGATLSEKAKAFCNNWEIHSIVLNEIAVEPDSDLKGNELSISADGSFRLQFSDMYYRGKWTADKTDTWLTLTPEEGVPMKLTVLTVTPDDMKVDLQDSDGYHTVLHYRPSKN